MSAQPTPEAWRASDVACMSACYAMLAALGWWAMTRSLAPVLLSVGYAAIAALWANLDKESA